MKIAWFTPFDKKSAIGYYSLLAVEELSKTHEVTVFAPEGEEQFETKVPVQTIGWDFSVERLNRYDYTVYNIGDYFGYHGEIYELALRHPGVFILHDLSIMNLLNGYYMLRLQSVERYRGDLVKYYGAEAANQILSAAQSPEKWAALDYRRFNGVDFCKDRAVGIVVHAKHHFELLRRYYDGPMAVVPFPFPKESRTASRDIQPDALRVMTVGNANRNKRIAQVIEAIGGDNELSGRLRYCVAGRTDGGPYEAELLSLIKRLRMQDSVELTGYVSEDRLKQLYRETDLLVNLRNPVIEGASWSLVEQMAKGKPVIVSNHGFYAEMPDDCVIKIDPDPQRESEQLRQKFRWILAHPAETRQIGENARRYIETHFSPEIYADTFTEFLRQLEFHQPLHQLIRQTAQELTAMGGTRQMAVCDRVAEAMDELFDLPRFLEE